STTRVSMAAIGMTFIIISGAIDLSVGSVVALSTVAIAYALDRAGFPPLLALLVGTLVGPACGYLNGTIITRLRVSPFIVTLGTLLLFRGVAKYLAGEQKIDAPMTWMSELLAKLTPSREWMFFAPGIWLTIAMAFGASFILTRTPFGRYVFAIGGNEKAAVYAGVDVPRVRRMVFMLGGLFIGLSGVLQFSRLTVGDPTVAIGMELDVIAAVVIGGASLSGGQGTIMGSLLGALMMATIRAGCSQLGLPSYVQEMVTGTIIIFAVALDRLRSRSTAR
ncbi:MAG TPA: ABC transporter permease, partial [Fimbriimonadaceae bacterium]|nr:ABC transporter permease [Fimbriimonadaceae bacterium]